MNHRKNRLKRPENKGFPQHLIDVKKKRGVAVPIEKVTVKIGTHTLCAVPVGSERIIASIENTITPRVVRKGYVSMMVGKVLKKIGPNSLSHLASEIME